MWLNPNILFNFDLHAMSSGNLLSPAPKVKQLPVMGAAPVPQICLILVLLCFVLMAYLIISLY